MQVVDVFNGMPSGNDIEIFRGIFTLHYFTVQHEMITFRGRLTSETALFTSHGFPTFAAHVCQKMSIASSHVKNGAYL